MKYEIISTDPDNRFSHEVIRVDGDKRSEPFAGFTNREDAERYVRDCGGLVLPGWTCVCGVFNGTAKEELPACRACGVIR